MKNQTELLRIPPIIVERYEQLYDLVQNKSKDGKLPAEVVAKYMGRDVSWFRRAICNGAVPFGFGDGNTGRATSYIGVLPFWQYETQCNLFLNRFGEMRK